MSTKNNPGAFRCYEAALPDEHFFTILARDPAGPATLRFWADERERVGKTVNPDDRDRIDDARRDASLMEEWRERNLDPMGDGSGPAWRLVKITDDDGGPIRINPDNTAYIPAERDGTEAVRLNVEWLQARTKDLAEGRLSRAAFKELIDLACQSPDRRRDNTGVEEEEAEDPLILRLDNLARELRDGRLPVPHELYRAIKKKVIVHIEGQDSWPWTYEAIGLGVDDLEEVVRRLRADTRPLSVNMTMKVPKDAMSRNFVFDEKAMDNTYISITDEMSVSLAVLVDTYRAGLSSPVAADPPVAETPRTSRDVTEIETPKDPPRVVDTAPGDLAHAPEVPPHRFSFFYKGERYAYARGLEINPTHLPVALDAMAADGWFLLAIFGQTDSKHVGFIFERRDTLSAFERAHGFGEPLDAPKQESAQYARFASGEPLDAIRADEINDRGRGLEP